MVGNNPEARLFLLGGVGQWCGIRFSWKVENESFERCGERLIQTLAKDILRSLGCRCGRKWEGYRIHSLLEMHRDPQHKALNGWDFSYVIYGNWFGGDSKIPKWNDYN